MFNVISGMAGAGRTGAFWRDRVEALLKAVAGPVAGFAVFVLAWQAVAMGIPEIPTPGVTWHAAQALFADPFYDNGPNDKGIGWNLLASLQRVAVGFGLAAIVGIPAGFAIGRYAALRCSRPSSACCGRCRRWPGCRWACCCSRPPIRPPSGRSSSVPSGP